MRPDRISLEGLRAQQRSPGRESLGLRSGQETGRVSETQVRILLPLPLPADLGRASVCWKWAHDGIHTPGHSEDSEDAEIMQTQ